MKKYKRYLLATLSLSALLLLTGCVSIDKTTKQPTGFVWNLIGRPMGEAIKFFATDLGLGFGLGIIIVTVIVRLIIFPLGVYQSWKATYQSEKMNYLKPIFAPIQERIKNAKTQEEKLMANQDLMMANVKMALAFWRNWLSPTLDSNALLLSPLLCSPIYCRRKRKHLPWHQSWQS